MGGVLFVNPRSGNERPSTDELRAEAEARGIAVRLIEPETDVAAAARAEEASVLGVAGGDGSLAVVAQAALERDLPFVCVPFGTRNHFARDVGLDRNDPVGALEAFAGKERRVDVGRVNGRLFLNNVSLGIYADLVHRRESRRRQREALAGLRALWRLAGRRGRLHVRVDGEPLAARVVLVANNSYKPTLFSLGERQRLDEGRLHLYSAAGWLPNDWRGRSGASFTIEAASDRLPAAVDGEPVELETPLALEAEPQALRVLLPPG